MWKEHKFATSLWLTPYPKVLNPVPVAIVHVKTTETVVYGLPGLDTHVVVECHSFHGRKLSKWSKIDFVDHTHV